MLSDDIADLLTSAGHGTVGSTADWSIEKLSAKPTSPERCIIVTPSGGYASEHAMSSAAGVVARERPRVQIVVRSPEPSTGEQKMNAIHHALDGVSAKVINGVTYDITAIQQPFFLGPDEKNRARFACNYDIWKTASS